jgi:hypothetical protein
MSDETQVTPDQTIEDNASVETHEEVKVHPAYDKLLAELPEAWHSKVTPYLQEQDKYFQQQLEKYTPFKEFVEEGVSADVIRGGINLANAIAHDPVEIFNNLQAHLRSQGLLGEEAAQAAMDIMEDESGESFGDLFDDEQVPAALQKKLDELEARQADADNYMYQQELSKATEYYANELETEMSQLRNAYSLSDAHERQIYNIMNIALDAGKEITIAEAARELQAMIGSFAPAGAQEEAPTIMGSAGGAGVPYQSLTVPKDDKGKKEMLQRMFEERQRQM